MADTPATNAIDKTLYTDGKVTHGMKGTVIPAAHKEKRGDLSGVHFDPAKPIAFTTIDYHDRDDDEDMTITKVSAETVETLAKANKIAPLPLVPGLKDPTNMISSIADPKAITKEGYLGFEEAAKIKGVAEAVAAAQPPQPQSPPPPPPQPSFHIDLDVPERRQTAPAVPKVKVRFSGQFGKLTVPYAQVFVYENFLVLVQQDEDGSFYEPPGDSQESIEVMWADRLYVCLPGVQFPMPDNCTHMTVLLIDDDATKERTNGQNGRG